MISKYDSIIEILLSRGFTSKAEELKYLRDKHIRLRGELFGMQAALGAITININADKAEVVPTP